VADSIGRPPTAQARRREEEIERRAHPTPRRSIPYAYEPALESFYRSPVAAKPLDTEGHPLLSLSICLLKGTKSAYSAWNLAGRETHGECPYRSNMSPKIRRLGALPQCPSGGIEISEFLNRHRHSSGRLNFSRSATASARSISRIVFRFIR
jgi:hypothetical protein